MHGDCKCFDWKDVSGGGGLGGDTSKACRLHPSADDLTQSGAGYSAYASTGSAAREWYARRAAASVATTANPAAALAEMGAPPGLDKDPCIVCTAAEPCLFDLLADPEERTDIAKANPVIVSTLAAALQAANAWRINGTMNEAVLKANYDCVTNTVPWWGNFSGPCCKPKGGGD